MKKKYLITLLIVLLTLTGCAGGSTEVGSETVGSSALPETIQWFNAGYAIITEKNQGDHTLIGGFDADNFFDVARI